MKIAKEDRPNELSTHAPGDETVITWCYFQGVVKGITSVKAVAKEWIKDFGEECVTFSSDRLAYHLLVSIDKVKGAGVIRRAQRKLSPERRQYLSDTMKNVRKDYLEKVNKEKEQQELANLPKLPFTY